jgi:hypothetical protein
LAGRRRRRRRVTTTERDKRVKTKKKKKKRQKTEKQKTKQNKGVGQVGAQRSAQKNFYWLCPQTFVMPRNGPKLQAKVRYSYILGSCGVRCSIIWEGITQDSSTRASPC